MKNKITDIFKTLRNEYMIIGLTGAVGSGCTTSAKFLSQKEQTINIDDILDNVTDKAEFSQEYRRSKILKNIYSKNKWYKFYHIQVSNILFMIIVSALVKKYNRYDIKDREISEGVKLVEILKNDCSDDEIEELIKICKKVKKALKRDEKNQKLIKGKRKKTIKIKKSLKQLNSFIEKYIDKENEKYTTLFQNIGKKIREDGRLLDIDIAELYGFPHLKKIPVLIIPKIIRGIIKLLDYEKKHKFYIIDALRNIYEIEFFKNRYSSFYLFSILASEKIRKERQENDFKYSPDTLKNIKKFETENKGISSQAIDVCIGKGDIFINNDKDDPSKHLLFYQLIKYIALIRNPGIFTPTDDERYMQLAFTARYNSGCISRQVGAVVVGYDGYIRGIGWNDVPEGHISCIYRTPNDLINNAENYIFSEYERGTEFYDRLSRLPSKVKNLPFCFKDIRNDIEKDKEIDKLKKLSDLKNNPELIEKITNTLKIKNPTRERALHAEENAFLQVSKSGGQSVIGGTLYTTDSPCQLCAKKTMQLKIARVVYIDAYTDISTDQTLRSGVQDKFPDFDMFSGAIGTAYFRLYIPIIGLKDLFKQLS